MSEWWARCALVAGLLLAGGAALAQDFPSRQVTILAPFPPGGGVDIISRTLGQDLEKRWGRPVIIENRPGAGGVVATQVLAKAAPDGHTLIVVATGHAINPHLYAKL